MDPENLICKSSKRMIISLGLNQNWTMFAPEVPSQTFWVTGKIFCQGQEPKIWGLEKIRNMSTIEKILNVRTQRFQSALFTMHNGRYNKRLLDGYAQYISEKQIFCPQD